MEVRRDFIGLLSADVSASVLMHLDDPADIVRASVVSRDWRRFVIDNGFCKKLFTRLHPEAPNFLLSTEERPPTDSGKNNYSEWENLEKEHILYATFIHQLRSPFSSRNCIASSIAASSTDNFPEESIENTLVPNERVNTRPSYWSSGGQKDPSIMETLTYRLSSNLCVVEQINIQPFQAYFQYEHPIYSSQAVRFRMGYSLLPDDADDGCEPAMNHDPATDEYIWTYVSPIFPMEQVNVLQPFKLPQPVLCVGGIIQIELLGGVQTQEMDGLYYICICHVQVIGQPLSAFRVDFNELSKTFALSYFPERMRDRDAGEPSGQSGADSMGSSGWQNFAERMRLLRAGTWNEVFLTTLLGGRPGDINDGGETDEDEDEDGDYDVEPLH